MPKRAFCVIAIEVVIVLVFNFLNFTKVFRCVGCTGTILPLNQVCGCRGLVYILLNYWNVMKITKDLSRSWNSVLEI